MTKGTETRYRVRGGTPLHGHGLHPGRQERGAEDDRGVAADADKGRTVLRNVPPIEDVRRAVELAQAVGARVEFHEAERTLVVDASTLTSPVLPAEIARRFRGSVLFVPALLHRFGEAVIEGIGGCNLGSRNLDFHYRGFARLGATVDEGESVIRITAPDGLRGAHLYLDTPSHTGTENLMMAASLAPGTTIIDNTAQEPEVLDMIAFLTKMGAEISGGGTGFITVHGVSELTAVEHTVMPDRIDAGVFAMAAAAAGGEINLVGANLDHLGVVRWKLEQMGVEFASNGAVLQVRREKPLRPINVITSPYPRVRHRPPVADHGGGDDGRRRQLHPRDDLRRPVHAGARAEQDGRQGRDRQQRRDRARADGAARLRGRRARPARRRGADPGGPGRRGRDRGLQRLPHRPRARDDRRAARAPSAPTSAPRSTRSTSRRRPSSAASAPARYARCGKARAAARNASLAAGVPIETRAPSPANGRTAMPDRVAGRGERGRVLAQAEPDEVRLA